jgi:hypothetical protein
VKHRKVLTNDKTNYLCRWLDNAASNPFGYFYLMPKLHKLQLSTQPVFSDCGSLPHGIGQWVDQVLQQIVKDQDTYFKNSFELKKLLYLLRLPQNASLFTHNTMSMYTKIGTEECIDRLGDFLKLPAITEFYGICLKATIKAVELVMTIKRMRFRDLIIRQISRTAMGMFPAPSLANLFVAIYKAHHFPYFVGQGKVIIFLKIFINNGFGIWLQDRDPMLDSANWEVFQDCVNNMGLK